MQLCHSTLKWYVTHTGGCGLSSGVGKTPCGSESVHLFSVISTHQGQHCVMEDYIMLVIPFATFDGYHAISRFTSSRSSRMASVVLIPELYSKRKNTGSVMRWMAASLPRLGFMLSQASKKRFNSSCVKDAAYKSSAQTLALAASQFSSFHACSCT